MVYFPGVLSRGEHGSWRRAYSGCRMRRDRLFTFLIRAHKDAARLARWLIEVEDWPDNKAHALDIEYEFALDLLAEYDRFLR
jgi:hypothetical protein